MFNTISKYMHNYALRKTRQQLLTLSSRQLEDVGVSRDLLVQGISEWPWREDQSQKLIAQPPRMNAKQINSAIRELSRMSDKDLRDIGIARGTIRDSVINGTPDRGPKAAA